ncbi:MAG TPA: HPF/RaiA family ribosome-associated protein [Burkholderiales bacterium]|nr:HPF/RaiA family ribosome-associated protein [Burkholderiales bacterium]
MELPLQITFHSIQRSDAIAGQVRSRARKLEKFFDRIHCCRVAIEAPHHRRTKGNEYRVRVEVSLPGQQLVVTRGEGDHGAYADVYAAIRDAFDAMRRQLEDHVALLRDKAKTAGSAQIEPVGQ